MSITDDCWIRVTREDIFYDDDDVMEYRGYKIALDIPNGGIIGVTVFDDDEAWGCPIEIYASDKRNDWKWCIALGKKKVDDLIKEYQQGQGQLTLL